MDKELLFILGGLGLTFIVFAIGTYLSLADIL